MSPPTPEGAAGDGTFSDSRLAGEPLSVSELTTSPSSIGHHATAFARLSERLGGLRLRGSDDAVAYCPVHEADGRQHRPSLSVDGANGHVPVKCHAGCATEHIVAVLGITMADLFDDPSQAGRDNASGVRTRRLGGVWMFPLRGVA